VIEERRHVPQNLFWTSCLVLCWLMLTIVKRSDLLQDSPVFGLDALSSAAYGPEAALTPLLALGSVASRT
jgi:hypothetical protein